jgi:hypothetical protein
VGFGIDRATFVLELGYEARRLGTEDAFADLGILRNRTQS